MAFPSIDWADHPAPGLNRAGLAPPSQPATGTVTDTARPGLRWVNGWPGPEALRRAIVQPHLHGRRSVAWV
ncbi:hypothetical protein BV378_02215 [Nostoc sp. RF31YmG]|nr:hypothetical protein BV378_02215 [Nostoc sp. RF31YmG]